MKNILIFILFFVLVSFLLYSLFFYKKIELINKKKNLTEELEKLKKEYVFMRFNVLNQNGTDSIVLFNLFNINGDNVTNFVLTNRGQDVFIESKVVVFKNSNAVVFPWRIYSDVVSPENGTFIGDYYVISGNVILYSSLGNDLREFINQLYSYGYEDKNKFIEMFFIAVLHTLNGVKSGKAYECIVHLNGGLELREVEYE